MTTAYINRIATAVPDHDVHQAFVTFASVMLEDRRGKALFGRMAGKSGITERFSCMAAADDPGGASVDAAGLFTRGRFPSTAQRMQLYERHAPLLMQRAVDRLGSFETSRISHVIVTSCTGLYAPGLDFDVVDHLGLNPSVERSFIGFMGCYAAINALKLARHIVRSEPASHVLVLNLELCTIHLQETQDLEQVLSFLVFGDGCAASIVSAEPHGLAMDSFRAVRIPKTEGLITWRVGDLGFDMLLSGKVPGEIGQALKTGAADVTGGGAEGIDLWAVHPGGRTVLDAVEQGLSLPVGALRYSRDILNRFGNMSSATVMFVLQSLMAKAEPGQRGCAMSFGPGLTAETMLFHAA
jgi:predicted naringenin-chalcone synthase